MVEIVISVHTCVVRERGFDALMSAIQQVLSDDSAGVPEGNTSERILVADDDPDILHLISNYLSIRGYATVSVKDGREALDYISGDSTIPLAVLDVSMPVMGGLEVLRAIMGRDPHPNAIMITALTDREVARQALNMGAFDYILKPFDMVTMEASIVACLRYVEYQKRSWWQRWTSS